MAGHKFTVGIIASLLLLSMTGCRTILDTFELAKPIRVAQVSDNPKDLITPFSPYTKLMSALSDSLGQPVRLEPAFPFQAEPHLRDGRYDLAIVTPIQYAMFEDKTSLKIVTTFAAEGKAIVRPAVLVVAANSDIQKVADLKDQKVAFGESDNSREYYAPLALLRANGMYESDLNNGVVGLSSFWRHVAQPRSRMQQILDGTVAAAFVDEADWNALPAEASDADAPDQAKLRVVAKTIAIPDLLIVASPMLDAEKLTEISETLPTIAETKPEVMKPIGCTRFEQISDETIEQMTLLVVSEMETE